MTDSFSFSYPVVDPKGPEFPEGVYRQNFLQVPSGTGTFFLMMLGYLVQIWSQVKHRAWANHRYTLRNITGDFVFDAPEQADQKDGKFWRVSSVVISIDAYPPKGNVVFGDPRTIHAGYFSWFRSSLQQDGLDWNLDGSTGGSGFQMSGFIGINLDRPFGDLKTTGSTPTTTDTAQNGTWDTQLHQQPAEFRVGVQVFGEVPPVRKSKFISASIVNQEQWKYPLQWLNWDKMWFEAPDPNVNGFILKLKPGVIASINVGLTVQDPQVSYQFGEGTNVTFNPMKGGAI